MEDSLVVGGNFLTGLELTTQLYIWDMEQRLKVPGCQRYPYYQQLMWHTAEHYLKLLQHPDDKDKVTGRRLAHDDNPSCYV